MIGKTIMSMVCSLLATVRSFSVMSTLKLFESFSPTAAVEKVCAIGQSLAATAYGFVVKTSAVSVNSAGSHVSMLTALNGRSCAAA